MLWGIFTIAVAATVLIIISDDFDLKWKVLAGGLLATSLSLRTVPFLAEHVHFVVPCAIDLALAVWGVIYWRS